MNGRDDRILRIPATFPSACYKITAIANVVTICPVAANEVKTSVF